MYDRVGKAGSLAADIGRNIDQIVLVRGMASDHTFMPVIAAAVTLWL